MEYERRTKQTNKERIGITSEEADVGFKIGELEGVGASVKSNASMAVGSIKIDKSESYDETVGTRASGEEGKRKGDTYWNNREQKEHGCIRLGGCVG